MQENPFATCLVVMETTNFKVVENQYPYKFFGGLDVKKHLLLIPKKAENFKQVHTYIKDVIIQRGNNQENNFKKELSEIRRLIKGVWYINTVEEATINYPHAHIINV